jgi:hypothetical protein
MQWENMTKHCAKDLRIRHFWPTAHSIRKSVEKWRSTLMRPKRTRIQKDPGEEKSIRHGWQHGRENNLENRAKLLPIPRVCSYKEGTASQKVEACFRSEIEQDKSNSDTKTWQVLIHTNGKSALIGRSPRLKLLESCFSTKQEKGST